MRRCRMMRRRWTARLALAFALAVLVWLAASYAVAYRLTRRQRAAAPEPAPAVAWARFRPARLRTVDGVGIGAWFAPGSPDAPSVVLLHGNGGGRGGCLTWPNCWPPRGAACSSSRCAP